VYGGSDNTGTDLTGTYRLFAGMNWGNLGKWEDILTYQYTADPSFHRYQSHYLNYSLFFSWQHLMTLFGGFSTIHPDIPSATSEGKNYQLSGRYFIPIKPLYTPLQHKVGAGIDYKNFNSNLFFVENENDLPVVTKKVSVFQLMASYGLEYFASSHELNFLSEIYGSFFSFLPNQSKEAYGTLRPGAQPHYVYLKGSVGEVYNMPFSLQTGGSLKFQLASASLLPSEQLGLGGIETVRGYEERVYNVDSGLVLNLELRTMPWSFYRKMGDQLRGLIFLDFGWGHNWDKISPSEQSDYLLGIGPGLRYDILPYVKVRIDYGFQLHHLINDDHFGRWHFGVCLSY
jgi:hemolysin activation/secretion protein